MAKRQKSPGKPSGKGKGLLQRAVSETGTSRRKSKLIVDTVVDLWKQALARGEDVELPIGVLHRVKRKKRRVLLSKSNLKGVKRKLFDINKKPVTVQLVKKKFGELNPDFQELAEPDVRAELSGGANESSKVNVEDRISRPVQFAHLSRTDLRWYR